MKSDHLLKTAAVCFTVLAAIFSAGTGYCDPDILVDEGKTELFQNMDLYTADAKFAAALGEDANNQKANFWRAVTVIATNSELKTILRNMGIIDASDSLALLDEEGRSKEILSKVDDIIIDSDAGSPGYSEEGTGWAQGTSGYGEDCRTHAAGGPGTSKAVWTPNITVAGSYYISMWWGYSTDNSPDAEVSIYYEDDDGTQRTRIFTLNQLQNCDGWSKLFVGRLSPGNNHRVEISDKGSGARVIADAVKFEFGADVIDDQSTGVVFNGGWDTVSDSRARNGWYKEIAAGIGGTCVWTPNIPVAGKYWLELDYIGSAVNASEAAYEIRVDGTLVDTVYINQRIDDDSRCNFGMYEFEAGAVNTVTLLQNSSGKVSVDTLRIISVRYDLTLTEVENANSGALTQADIALGYLENVSEAFQDTVTVDTYTAEIDCGDALMLKSLLNLYKAQANIFAAYDMDDLSPTKIASTYEELISINWVLNTYANLGSLKPDAAAKLSAANAALINGLNGYFDSYNFIVSEADDQNDDLITFDPEDLAYTGPINDKLAEVIENLNGALPSFTVSSDDFDKDGPYFKTTINLRAFFDNPTAPRSILPSFDNEDNIIRNSWLNPAFGGILPDMTAAQLDGLAKLGSDLGQPQALWEGDTVSIILNWKIDTYADFVRYKIYRSATDDVSEDSTLIYDSANKDVTTYTDSDINENQRTYYYRLYTYYADGDKIEGLIRRIVTKIYIDGAATEPGNGSPYLPYQSLREGIEDAGIGAKVCVAEGTYPENEESFWDLSRKAGLILEGGYESTGWTRDITAHPAIIDGSGLEGNVIGIYNVSDITIDGFTIKGAQYNGINLNNAAGINVKNCALINNGHQGFAADGNSTAIIENCAVTDNGHDGVAIWQNGNSMSVTGCYIARNGQRGIHVQRTATIVNNLIDSNNGTGIECWGGNYDVSIINNTIVNNKSMGGINYSNMTGGNVVIKNNNLAYNNGGWNNGIYGDNVTGPARVITHNNSYGHAAANYANCGTGEGQNNNISADPKFVSGSLGGYYISQIASGQASDSPAVDAGSDTAANLGLQALTTRTDEGADTEIVDLGYHYRMSTVTVTITLNLPNGGESLDAGAAYDISWTTSGSSIDHIKLLYSTDGGTSYPNEIISGTADDGIYSWTVPDISSTAVKIKAVAEDNVNNLLAEDESDGNFTVTYNRPPLVGAITPSTGTSGPNQAVTFTAAYFDPDGWQNIRMAQLRVNNIASSKNCFAGYYNQNINRLYLRNDANTGWLGGFAPGSSNIIENSYAKLNCAGVTVSGDGDTLTIGWSVIFKESFSGKKRKTYLYAQDDAGLYNGWISVGAWTINRAPATNSVSPNSGSGLVDTPVTFTAAYFDPDGWQNIRMAQLRVNNIASSKNCFAGYYNQNINRLYLRNDANTGWLGGFAPGSSNIIENSYAKLNCAGVTVSGDGDTLTIGWSVIFKPAFTGTKKTYLYTRDDTGAYDGWDIKGIWTINP